MWRNVVLCLPTYLLYHALGAKVQKPGSPNEPTMLDDWVVRLTFGSSAYMMCSQMTMKEQYRYVLFTFQQYQKVT